MSSLIAFELNIFFTFFFFVLLFFICWCHCAITVEYDCQYYGNVALKVECYEVALVIKRSL